MIAARIYAGLGNQMMQYAAAKALSLDRRQPLLLEAETGFVDEFYGRKFGLDHFTITAGRISPSKIPSSLLPAEGSKNLLGKLVNKARASITALTWDHYTEHKVSPYKPFTSRKKNILLNGLFFSDRYFRHHRQAIWDEFRLKQPFTGRNAEVEREMQGVESVAVHVRMQSFPGELKRGAKNVYGLLGNDFYNEALGIIASRHGRDLKCYVFSEDIPWVRENLKLDFPFEIMDHNDDDHNYLDIMLMSRCRHNIVAKSTFSWWSAWLNRNPGKTVIAPKEFFQKKELQERATDIYPEEWIKL